MYTRRLVYSLALALGLLLGLLWLMGHTKATRADSGVLYVDSEGSCGGRTPCYVNIQAAVDAAQPGGEIRIAGGTYTGTHGRVVPNYGLDSLSPIYSRNTQPTTQVVVITKSVTLRGGYAVDDWGSAYPATWPTVIDAQGDGRAVLIVGDDEISPTLDGLVITGGDASNQRSSQSNFRASGSGGGVYASFALPTIANCVITHNVGNRDGGGYGGGIYIFKTPTGLISGSIIISNTAAFSPSSYANGGGLYVYGTSISIQNNRVQNNVALGGGGAYFASASGGGIYLEHYNSTLTGNFIQGNVASTIGQGAGGGVYVGTGAATLRGNTIQHNIALQSGNRTGYGGGVCATAGWLLENNRILSNTASLRSEAYGGGVHLGASSMDLISNTIRGNIASSDTVGHGGGVSVVALPGGTTLPVERNQIVGNRASVGSSGEGGGLFFERIDLGDSGRIEMQYNLVHANFAGGESGLGGGLYVYNAQEAYLDANTFSYNQSHTGGGLYLKFSAPITLTNNLLVRNSAAGSGGGLWAVGGTAGSPVLGRLAHNTWVNNGDTAVWADTNTILTMSNSIVTSHTTGLAVSNGGSIRADHALFFANGTAYSDGVSSEDETNDDPAFVDPASDDYHLRPESPAIDAGAALTWVHHDRDGRARPDCTSWDLGAFEQRSPHCWRGYLPVMLQQVP